MRPCPPLDVALAQLDALLDQAADLSALDPAPLALDCYAGGGVAARGLMAAGFRVIGIDTDPRCRRNYPGAFICADVLRVLPALNLHRFDLLWGSPPCQRWSAGTNCRGNGAPTEHPDLIAPTRDLFYGHPAFVIENGPRAPVRPDVVLTGPSVGLERIFRQRHFEISWLMLSPTFRQPPRWMWDSGVAVTITTSMCATSHYWPRKRAGLPGRVPVAEARAVMGLPREAPVTGWQLGEGIPTLYAYYLARELIRQWERSPAPAPRYLLPPWSAQWHGVEHLLPPDLRAKIEHQRALEREERRQVGA